MDLPQLPSRVSPVPATQRDSFKAWCTYSQQQAAESELYLFSRSSYFRGARLGNAPVASAMSDAFNAARQGDAAKKSPNARYATISTETASNGKVGYIRPVDLGSQSHGALSYLFRGPTDRLVNTVEIGTPERTSDETDIVIVHGYGAGAAFFYRNMQALASVPNSRLYAIDWLGMGRSSRPHFPLPSGRTVEERMKSTEDFFVESLEQWRIKMRIERMVLVGHSLGGYMSTVYALRYPERVSRLVLVSPAGFSGGSLSDIARRFTSRSNGGESQVPFLMTPRGQRLLTWAWNNVSPFAFVRSTTFFGPYVSSTYTRRRFGALEPDELRAIHAYCHGIFSDRSSSEKCCAYLLTCAAYPRARRIRALPACGPHCSDQDTRFLLVWLE